MRMPGKKESRARGSRPTLTLGSINGGSLRDLGKLLRLGRPEGVYQEAGRFSYGEGKHRMGTARGWRFLLGTDCLSTASIEWAYLLCSILRKRIAKCS